MFLGLCTSAPTVKHMTNNNGTGAIRRTRPTKAELHAQRLKARRRARERTRREKRAEHREAIDWFVNLCAGLPFKDVPKAWTLLGMIFLHSNVHQDVRDYAAAATDRIFSTDEILIAWGQSKEADNELD